MNARLSFSAFYLRFPELDSASSQAKQRQSKGSFPEPLHTSAAARDWGEWGKNWASSLSRLLCSVPVSPGLKFVYWNHTTLALA